MILVGLRGRLLLSKDNGQSFAIVTTPSNKAMANAITLPDGDIVGVGEGGVSTIKP